MPVDSGIPILLVIEVYHWTSLGGDSPHFPCFQKRQSSTIIHHQRWNKNMKKHEKNMKTHEHDDGWWLMDDGYWWFIYLESWLIKGIIPKMAQHFRPTWRSWPWPGPAVAPAASWDVCRRGCGALVGSMERGSFFSIPWGIFMGMSYSWI